MADWDVGTQVICIKGFTKREMYRFLEIHPEVGQILTIREHHVSDDSPDGLFLRFFEIRNDKFLYLGQLRECCFNWKHFRPVRQTDISALRDLATTLPLKEELMKEIHEEEKKELENV